MQLPLTVAVSPAAEAVYLSIERVHHFATAIEADRERKLYLLRPRLLTIKGHAVQWATIEQNQPVNVEVGGSVTIINGNVEIHDHRHGYMHVHIPSPPLQENLKSHEISREWQGLNVEAECLRRREDLLRELRTRKPVDPYCGQKQLEHEARVRQIQQHMQMLIERSRRR